MRVRRLLAGSIGMLVVVGALVAAPATGSTTPGLSQTQAMRAQLAATACDIPTELLVRGWRGHRADRSGDIDIIPAGAGLRRHGRAAALGPVGLRRPGAAAGSTGPGTSRPGARSTAS